MKKILAIVFYICVFSSAWAQDIDAIFQKANAAYTAGEYEQAIELYDSLEQMGRVSASIHYNLGNSHYKLNHIAPAILQYERALNLDPGMEDAAYNLKLANLRVVDNVKTVPQLFIVEWLQDMITGRSAGQWAIIALVFLWLALLAGVAFVFIHVSQVKRVSFFSGIALLFLSLISVGISLQRLSAEKSGDEGIIFSKNVYVKDSPNGSTDLLILHEGIKVDIVEETGNWTQIKVEDANIGEVIGFIPTESIEVI